MDVRLEEEATAEPPQAVGAEREERQVPEIEQAGEADHDVETKREHHIRERDDLLVHEVARVGEEEWRHRPDHDHQAGEGLRPPRRQPPPTESRHSWTCVRSPLQPPPTGSLIRLPSSPRRAGRAGAGP